MNETFPDIFEIERFAIHDGPDTHNRILSGLLSELPLVCKS